MTYVCIVHPAGRMAFLGARTPRHERVTVLFSEGASRTLARAQIKSNAISLRRSLCPVLSEHII